MSGAASGGPRRKASKEGTRGDWARFPGLWGFVGVWRLARQCGGSGTGSLAWHASLGQGSCFEICPDYCRIRAVCDP